MSGTRSYPPGTEAKDTVGAGLVGADDLLQLWFALAPRGWSSLVIAPAHPDGSVAELARSLADVGKHLSYYPVSAVTLDVLGPRSVRALAELARHVGQGKATPVRAQSPSSSSSSNELQRLLTADFREDGEPEDFDEEAPSMAPPAGQLIIAIPSVISEPLGIAIARAADAVVLAVEVNRTRIADTNRTIETIGREHIAGTCLIRRDPTA